MKSIVRTLALLLSLGLSNLAMAQTTIPTIDATSAPYNSIDSLRGVGIASNSMVRAAALSSAAGAYRARYGIYALTKLKIGERFKMKYQDGTSETALVESQTSSLGAVPVPGTQRDANGALVGGYSGGGSGGTGSTWGIIGYQPIYGTGVACGGGICTTTTVLLGYEPIYGWIKPTQVA